MIPFLLLFVALSSLLGCLGALVAGSLLPLISASALLLGLLGSWFLARRFNLKLETPALGKRVTILYALVIVGIYFHSVFLFFQKGDFYWIQNPFNLGDMSFHWNVINYLAKGAHFWPENPIYAGYRFKYPFGMDFFNALFANLGVGMETHLPLVTLGMLLLVFGVLHACGGPLLVFAVFFSGGVFNIFNNPSWDPNQLQEALDFKNLFLTVLLTQRGVLYALPAGVFLYRALQNAFAGAWKPGLPEKLALGLIWGALGFFHLHSFFFLSLFFGVWILYHRELKTWLPALIVAAGTGLPFVINALWPEAGTMPLVHWNARGWNRAEGVGYFSYWLQNLGVWILAVGSCAVIFYRQKNWDRLLPTALALILFVLFSHLILAPWAWDNIKLLLWCYVLALMACADVLWNKRSEIFKSLLFVGLCLPGLCFFLSALPVFYRGASWVSQRELNRAAVVLQGQDVNEGLVVAPHWEHPALVLGYKLYMGYSGHVWSHGYNYVEREERVNRLYDGQAAAVAELPQNLVHLVYWGPLERRPEKTPPPGLQKISEALSHDLYRIELKK